MTVIHSGPSSTPVAVPAPAKPAAGSRPRGRLRLRRPWRTSLQWRIIFAYGAVFLLILSVLTIWIGRVVYNAQVTAAEHHLEVTAFLAANALVDPLSGYAGEFAKYQDKDGKRAKSESDDDGEKKPPISPADSLALLATAAGKAGIVMPRLQQVAALYARDSRARITILDAKGNVLADSLASADTVANQAQQPEVQAALAGRAEQQIRSDDVARVPTVYAAAPIPQGSEILGLVQASKAMDVVTADARQLLLSMAAAGLVALLLATVLSIWLARRILRPVRQMQAAAIAVGQGDLNQTVSVATQDELGALATAFNEMVREVRTMLDQQRMFVANASHELRTPLTNIKLRSEALTSLDSADAALTARYLAEIESEADRLTRLADELLDLTRLEEDDLDLPPTPIDPSAVIEHAADIMGLRAETAGIVLQTTVDPGLPPLRVRPEQIEGALINLIDNAIKYSPSGSWVFVSAYQQGCSVVMCVADNGSGIPPEDLPYIFDRFYRVDKVRSRRKGRAAGLGAGAGLGLSITQAIVERNGGAIRVESEHGRGTTFILTFPTA